MLCYLHYSSSERAGVERLILTVYAQCTICPPSTFEEPWGSCYPQGLQLHLRYLLLHSDWQCAVLSSLCSSERAGVERHVLTVFAYGTVCPLPHLKRKHQQWKLPLPNQTNLKVKKTFPITADIRSIMIRVKWQNRHIIKFTFPKEVETLMCFVS